LAASLKLPAAHVPQVRSAIAEPAVAIYSPAKQSLQVVHAMAPAALLKVPAAHAAQLVALLLLLKVPGEHAPQVRSAVAEPGPVTY